ncbi:MAG: FAD-binding oxidoreductase [Acidimicrobiales bacterium]
MSAPQWQQACVVAVERMNAVDVALRLELPESRGYLPGQYYNVQMALPGRPTPVQRAYSLSSSPVPESSVIEIGVREEPGGLVSPRLVRSISVGDEIRVRGPYGRFTWTEEDRLPLLLIGAGSGVVPFVSMIRYGAEVGNDVPVRLLISSRNAKLSMYFDELASLERRYPWLDVTYTFTRDTVDHRARHHRRLDRAMLSELIHPSMVRHTYVCGPSDMVEQTRNELTALGVDAHSIRFEKFD